MVSLKRVGAIAGAVVGHDAFDPDALLGVARNDEIEEAAAAVGRPRPGTARRSPSGSGRRRRRARSASRRADCAARRPGRRACRSARSGPASWYRGARARRPRRTRTGSRAAVVAAHAGSCRAGRAPGRRSRGAGPAPRRGCAAPSRYGRAAPGSAAPPPHRDDAGTASRSAAGHEARPNLAIEPALQPVPGGATGTTTDRGISRRHAIEDQAHDPATRLERVPQPTRLGTVDHPGLRVLWT